MFREAGRALEGRGARRSTHDLVPHAGSNRPTRGRSPGGIPRAEYEPSATAPPRNEARVARPPHGIRHFAPGERRRVAVVVARPDRARGRGRPVAGPRRRGVLLPPHVDASGLAEYAPLRARAVARLSLLLRACDVGRGDISPATFAAHQSRCRFRDARLPNPDSVRGT